MISAFALGLLGSLHCFLMCGPLVAANSLRHPNSGLKSALVYQLGRISVYAILGFLVGMAGYGFSLIGLHQYLAIIVGCTLIFMGIQHFFVFPKMFQLKTSFITHWVIRLKGIFWTSSSFWMGAINGLLPCGLVYIALSGALVYDNPQNSLIYMILFGLGTCPVMIGCYLFPKLNIGSKISFLDRLFPIAIFIMGVWILSRGLGLGIPYLSPGDQLLKIEQVEPKKSCS